MQPPNKEEAWVDPTWERLEDQIAWYEGRSARAQSIYTAKIVQIIVSALIPFVAGFQEQLKALAERIEELVADEHSGWLDTRARSEGRSVN